MVDSGGGETADGAIVVLLGKLDDSSGWFRSEEQPFEC